MRKYAPLKQCSQTHLRGRKISSDNDLILAANEWFDMLEIFQNHWDKCISGKKKK